MEQYRLFAECFLPEHMLDWFELKTLYRHYYKRR